MEKIYENEGTFRRQSLFQKFFNDKGSMIAVIVVAIVAIVGLVTFGFNQISFAADSVNGLPDSFESAQGDTSTKLIGETIDGTGNVLPILGFYAIVDEDGTRVPIFCMEYNVSYSVGQTYNKGAEITDQGLIFLMSQLYPNKPIVDSSTGTELSENIQMWLTQSAIWTYLYETGNENNSDFSTVNAKVKQVSKLYADASSYAIDTGAVTLYEKFGITTLIEQAKAYRTEASVNLVVRKNSELISITNDNRYYQTDLISVTGSTSSPIINSFEGYSVDLSRSPEGTVLVDESGNVYADVNNMAPTAKFYVRVPTDKVTNENKRLQISINGIFKMYGAHAYGAGSYQKVANVDLLNKSESKPLDIELDYTPPVENTKMTTAQALYFVGLIILLSGVGIIYANTRQREN